MFRVIWTDDAFDQMNRIVSNNRDAKAALARILRDMAEELIGAPESAGESRDDGTRFACYGPLGVWFHVNASEHLVRVSSVHLHQPIA